MTCHTGFLWWMLHQAGAQDNSIGWTHSQEKVKNRIVVVCGHPIETSYAMRPYLPNVSAGYVCLQDGFRYLGVKFLRWMLLGRGSVGRFNRIGRVGRGGEGGVLFDPMIQSLYTTYGITPCNIHHKTHRSSIWTRFPNITCPKNGINIINPYKITRSVAF